jgi:glycosyltransferase involved in cell wall biosynthesis
MPESAPSSSTANSAPLADDRQAIEAGSGLAQVLLSTFNGAAHLERLLESVLAQDYPELELLVRDDGSTDGTISILKGYAENNPRVRLLEGPHLGFVASFFTLLAQSTPRADWYAFCDQDDVWRPDKVSRAVRALRRINPETPALYGSRLAIVDADERPLGLSAMPRRELSFANALVESQIPGCTAVLNRATRSLMLWEVPRGLASHDWWFYLVVSGFGTVLFDPEPRIRYRRHGENVFGDHALGLARWIARSPLLRGESDPRPATRQAMELRRIHGSHLPAAHARLLDRFLAPRSSFWSRLRYAHAGEVYRQARRDQVALKLRILLDRL